MQEFENHALDNTLGSQIVMTSVFLDRGSQFGVDTPFRLVFPQFVLDVERKLRARNHIRRNACDSLIGWRYPNFRDQSGNWTRVRYERLSGYATIEVQVPLLNRLYQTNLLLLQQDQIINDTGSRDILLIYEALGTI